jgi:hypothetical protein
VRALMADNFCLRAPKSDMPTNPWPIGTWIADWPKSNLSVSFGDVAATCNNWNS